MSRFGAVYRLSRGYADYAGEEKPRLRVTVLNADGKMEKELADMLNAESFFSAHGHAFTSSNIHELRRDGRSKLSKSTEPASIRASGRMAPILCKEQRNASSKSPTFVCHFNAIGDQGKRHHDILASPNTLAHSLKLRLVVMMTLVRS